MPATPRPAGPRPSPAPLPLAAIVALAALPALVGCGGGAAVQGPPAAPGELLTGFAEPLPRGPGDILYLRNNASFPVTITSVSVHECLNISGGCWEREPGWVLAPGEVRRVARVAPGDRQRAWRYRWRWTHASGAAAADPALARPAPPPMVLGESEAAKVLLDPRGRFVNVVLPETRSHEIRTEIWSTERSQRITRILYRSFEDAFDVIFVVFPDDAPGHAPDGQANHARPAAEGIGQNLGNRTGGFGSEGRLLAALMLRRHALLDDPVVLHEVAHVWAQYLVPSPASPAHWGFAGVGGALGGWEPGTLEPAGAGHWIARGPGRETGFDIHGTTRIPVPYAPQELYLMGLLPADSVPPFEVAEDAGWVEESIGLFRASRIRTVTVEDLAAVHGPRIPRHPDAPQEHRGLYAVVSSAPLDDAVRNRIHRDVEEFARPGPSELRWTPNFWEATGGRGRLVMDRLDEAVREPL